jgi:hypothetical protein
VNEGIDIQFTGISHNTLLLLHVLPQSPFCGQHGSEIFLLKLPTTYILEDEHGYFGLDFEKPTAVQSNIG